MQPEGPPKPVNPVALNPVDVKVENGSYSSENLENQFERSTEYLNKASKMKYSRNWNARNWVILVMSYYIVRATFIIFPWWEYNSGLQKTVIIL